MADVIVSQQVTKEDIVDAYDKGMHPTALVEKFGVPLTTVMAVINEAFPQDIDGEDIPVVELAEGESPEAAVKKAK